MSQSNSLSFRRERAKMVAQSVLFLPRTSVLLLKDSVMVWLLSTHNRECHLRDQCHDLTLYEKCKENMAKTFLYFDISVNECRITYIIYHLDSIHTYTYISP